MDSMEQKMDSMEQRMDSMEQKQENMSNRMDSDHKGILDVFEKYEASVEKMYQENRKKILVIEKKLKIANMQRNKIFMVLKSKNKFLDNK